MIRRKPFPKIGSLDDKKSAELHDNQINRNREIQKEYALAEKQTQDDMKKLQRQKLAAIKRI